MLRRLGFLFTSLVCSIFLTNPVAALELGDVVMSITPAAQDLELTPGQEYTGVVVVANSGRLAFDISVSVSPYYVSDDSGYYTPDFTTESSYTKLQNWITLSTDSVHLEPGSRANIEFTVDVPTDAPSGGQYAAIMLLSDSGEADDGGMKVNSQLAAILYGHVNGGTIRTEGTLLEHTLPGFMFNPAISISETVQNTGNVDFKVVQSLTIREFFSNQEIINPNSVSESGQPLGYAIATVLPGTTRTSIITWEDVPSLGLFIVEQNIAFLDQQYNYSQLVFVCPSWILVALIALIVVLALGIVYRIAARRKADHTPLVQ